MRKFLMSAMIVSLTLVSACSSMDKEARDRLVSTYTQLAIEYMQRGENDVAKENLLKAFDVDSDNVQANSVMALLQWRMKDYSEAEKYFRKTLSLDRKNSETWNNFGVFLCERGNFDEGEEAFKRALSDPTYKTPAEANVNAGNCEMRKPAPAIAERYYRSALDINPQQSQALLELAKLTYNDGRTLSSRAFLQRYFAAHEETPEALYLAIKVEQAFGNSDAVAKYTLDLRGKFPNSPEVALLEHKPDTKRKK